MALPFLLSFYLSLFTFMSVSLPLCAKPYSHRETAGLCPVSEGGREGATLGGVEEV